MFAPFSSGYYVGRLVVEPHDGETALIHRDHHRSVNQELYASGDGIERLDHPLVMKLYHHHFAVHGDDGVPDHTLLVPESVLADIPERPFPAVLEVLLAKAEMAPKLLSLLGIDGDFVAT